jgi:hypothetical protein
MLEPLDRTVPISFNASDALVLACLSEYYDSKALSELRQVISPGFIVYDVYFRMTVCGRVQIRLIADNETQIVMTPLLQVQSGDVADYLYREIWANPGIDAELRSHTLFNALLAYFADMPRQSINQVEQIIAEEKAAAYQRVAQSLLDKIQQQWPSSPNYSVSPFLEPNSHADGTNQTPRQNLQSVTPMVELSEIERLAVERYGKVTEKKKEMIKQELQIKAYNKAGLSDEIIAERMDLELDTVRRRLNKKK